MTAYATLSDLYAHGLPSAALQSVSTSDQQSALDARNAWADGKLSGRYQLPLLAWDVDLRMAVAQLTAYDLLVRRGYNSAAGADINVRLRYQDAIKWFDDVERQNVHPNVTQSQPPGTSYDAPTVLTSPTRGW